MKVTKKIADKIIELSKEGFCEGLGEPEPGKMCVEAAVCYALGVNHGDKPDCVSPVIRKLMIQLNDARWSSNQARGDGLRKLSVAQLGTASDFDDVEFARRLAKISITKTVPKALRHAASIYQDERHKKALLDAANRCEQEGNKDAAADAADAADAAARAAARAAYADAADASRAADAVASAYASRAADAAAADAVASAEATAAAADAVASAEATARAAYAAASASRAAARAAYAAASAEASADAADAVADQELMAFADEVLAVLIDMKAPGVKWLSLCDAA